MSFSINPGIEPGTLRGNKMHSPEQLAAFDSGRRLRARVLQTDCLPPIPQTLFQLLEIIQQENSSANNLEDVILRDQALAAKVLRAANSAYYGFCGKVTTVSRAVVAIGFHEVQNICLCALLMQHFHSEAVNQKEQMQLWQHSFATGGLARSIAQLRPWIQTEESYVLGLLHDLGRMVLMFYFLDDYHQIHKLATESSVSFYVAEERHGMPHTLIGKWLAIKWHLPTVYQIVMEYHHVPLSAPQSQKEVSLIYLADVLAYAEDIANQPNQDYVNECCDQLYISKDEWQYLGEKAIAIRNESVNMWNMLKPA